MRYGSVRGNRVASLLSQFLLTHPNAHDPNAIDLVDGTMRSTGSAWPYSVQIAGDVIRLATGT